MRAAVLHAPGDLRIEEHAPGAPTPGEVLVRVAAGGICGSDLHYFRHGGFGAVRLREPMILGHEVAGHVVALGAGAHGVAVGDLVAVNPSTSCGKCEFCQAGLPIHCSDMRFLGSAMRTPHVQGGFSDLLICKADNAVVVPGPVSPEAAAFTEPLAVCLHAVAQALVDGARVLVVGAGPIGVLLILAARFAGASEVVATDVMDAPLRFARAAGADRTINVASDPGLLSEYRRIKGHFDVVFEAAGQGGTIAAVLPLVRPRGKIVLVGQGAVAELPVSEVVGREIALQGSFRFDGEFALAAQLIGSGVVDVAPLLTSVLPLAAATEAFELAADKSRSLKVQLSFA